VESFPGDFYTTDYFTRHAVRFIDEADARKPFFLYTAYTAPHRPLHAWPRDIGKYRRRYLRGWDELRAERFQRQRDPGLRDGVVSRSDRNPESPPWEDAGDHDWWDHRMATYAAQVESMDRGVGEILAALERNRCRDNTVVMFLSDNGACEETIGPQDTGPLGTAGSFTSYLLPWANASSTPFRLFKHWTHEGGIATPFIASWPARIAGPRIERRRIGHVKDLMATCLELAGAPYPAERNGVAIPAHSGTSLVPAFLGKAPTGPQLVVGEHEGNRAVRLDNWKAVSWYSEARGYVNQKVGEGRRTSPWELYDLADDRCELNDLARDEPRRLRDLVAVYEDWAVRTRVADWQDIQAAWGGRSE
jgi:arylsulfatase